MSLSPHILLTGGTGFFGKALLRFFCNQDCSTTDRPTVTILSRCRASFATSYPEFVNQPWLELHEGNICHPDTLPRNTGFTHIIHAAADSTMGPQLTPLQRFDQIVTGTRNLLELAVECGAKRFLFTSSGAIYGPQPPSLDRIPEEWHGSPDLLNPANAYGEAKRAAEHLCSLYADQYEMECVIARCFAFVGEDLPLDVHFAIGNFIRDALHKEVITVAGDGSPLRTYLHQDDLAEWLWALLLRGRSGEAYNVGSDEVVSIAELAHLVREILAPRKQLIIQGQVSASGQRNRYLPHIGKAQRELGLTVRIPLHDAIRRFGKQK